MYLEHFGLAEAPFRITPHTDFFFAGANRGATLEALLYAITHDEGIVKISGEVGTGKTILCRVLMERLPAHVSIVYLANPSLSPDDILYAIADELQLEFPKQIRRNVLLKMLQKHLTDLSAEGKRVVVLIDEANAMPAESLEEIRLLSNLESNRHKLMQLVLFGQPELNNVLARPDMRQLKERITHNFTLEPLSRDNIAEYLDFRMRAAGYKGAGVFSAAAVKEIAKASLGLTRRINILADKALLAASAQHARQVTPRHVRAAIADSQFGNVATRTSASAWKSGMALVLALLLVSGGIALSPWWTNPTPFLTDAQWLPATRAIQETPSAPATPAAISALPAAAQPPMPEAWKPLGKLTRQRLQEQRGWFAEAPDDRWFVQLLGTDTSKAQQVEDLLVMANRLLDPGQVRVYYVEMRGTQRIGVIYGSYAAAAEAEAAIRNLPAPLRAGNPYPRQIIRLR